MRIFNGKIIAVCMVSLLAVEAVALTHITSAPVKLTSSSETTSTSSSYPSYTGYRSDLGQPDSTVTPENSSSPQTTPRPVVSPSTVSSAATSSVTNNWAGYAATGATYTAVSGSWIVPQASSSSSIASDATWIGIGGMNSDDLIQTGTQNIASASGQVASSAFFEMLPDASQPIPSLTVSPGDTITASIINAGDDQWTIRLSDTTTGQSYTTTVSYDSTESSAEWIEEDPSDGESEIPFDDFGSVTFDSAATTANGSSEDLSSSGAQALTMINDEDGVLASTSSLGSDAASFTVSRGSASSDNATNIPDTWRRHGAGIGRE